MQKAGINHIVIANSHHIVIANSHHIVIANSHTYVLYCVGKTIMMCDHYVRCVACNVIYKQVDRVVMI